MWGFFERSVAIRLGFVSIVAGVRVSKSPVLQVWAGSSKSVWGNFHGTTFTGAEIPLTIAAAEDGIPEAIQCVWLGFLLQPLDELDRVVWEHVNYESRFIAQAFNIPQLTWWLTIIA
jgi:hypothetical protein